MTRLHLLEPGQSENAEIAGFAANSLAKRLRKASGGDPMESARSQADGRETHTDKERVN